MENETYNPMFNSSLLPRSNILKDEKQKGNIIRNNPEYNVFPDTDILDAANIADKVADEVADVSESDNTSSFNCLLVTHNSILQCNIDKLSPRQGNTKIRFMNCAILCLTLDLNTGNFTINLVYNGLLSEEERAKISSKRPYYTNENFQNPGYMTFTPINSKITDDNRLLNLLPSDLNVLKTKLGVDKINFYIVRHGQAEHNEKKWNKSGFGLQLDTSVTQEGQQQALQAARALKNILKRQNIDQVLTSDLRRTRDTALPFFSILNILPRKIIIIPCANELESNGDGSGNCNQVSARQMFNPRENYPACTPQTCPSMFDTINLTESPIDIDWSLYSTFYKNKMRGYPNLTDHPNCKDTNMISMAVFYLLTYEKIGIGQQQLGEQILGEREGELSVPTMEIGGSKPRKRVTRRLNKKTKRDTKRITKRITKRLNKRNKTKRKRIKT